MSVQNEEVEAPEIPETPDYRRVAIPPNRRTYLKNNFPQITEPIIKYLKLDLRYNSRKGCVELRTNALTSNPNAMTKAIDFLTAINAGFEIADALALVRLEDIFMDVFDVTDIKLIEGDNLSRAVGRIAGKGGQIKFTIENATHTRISLTGTKVHILGSVNNVKMARRVICDLVMGSPANKIYSKLRNFQAWQKRQG
ncbi:KH domain containing protein [Trichomonas vaginalis G3]|uniref:KH domain containing protein n=1 Tax=Trichomonas vaginalis (strain ATCC PRA-98 / G3) TaxID=412133 RepID=A2F7I8_TRIV3|nr:RNA binding [Trichomonas vaginalis G3]EAX99146.1 KH domain containing protein [Trichomonas vaginalis G3]KAI5549182.1 RNA binding [Trichomonas vaginalis G3]|eukprot:XP_001312076.1 KH domain containing protein [Trichomonas vaginalis G3]